MSQHSVLLLGATGETGADILNGLLEDGSFDITCLIRPQSAEKPATQKLKDSGVKIAVIDLSSDVDELTQQIQGYDTIISAIGPREQKDQLKLVNAAAKAGTKRFVPCGFTTICPPNVGIMLLRDDKEIVHERIWYHHLPYTIIDVGFWHQISWPRLSSGKTDYAAIMPHNVVFGDGNAPNLLTDKRDIGRFVARIIKDERTLNKKVFTYSDALSQNEINKLMEEKSGEKLEITKISSEDVVASVDKAREAYKADPSDPMKATGLFTAQYNHSKYVRGDNSPRVAEYLGYIDGKKLYPDFKPISFSDYLDELLDGKGVRPYGSRFAASK